MTGIPGAVFIANLVLLAGLIIQLIVGARIERRHQIELERYRDALRAARRHER